jgi:hypothetical protein
LLSQVIADNYTDFFSVNTAARSFHLAVCFYSFPACRIAETLAALPA